MGKGRGGGSVVTRYVLGVLTSSRCARATTAECDCDLTGVLRELTCTVPPRCAIRAIIVHAALQFHGHRDYAGDAAQFTILDSAPGV